MALYKSIAGKTEIVKKEIRDEKGNLVNIEYEYLDHPSTMVEMSAEEEAVIRAEWALRDAEKQMPVEPDINQKFEWLAESKQKYDEMMSAYVMQKSAMQPVIDQAHAEWRRLEKIHIDKVEAEKSVKLNGELNADSI